MKVGVLLPWLHLLESWGFSSSSPAAFLPLMIGLEEEKPPELVQAFHTCSKGVMFIALLCEGNQMGAP